MFNQAFVNIKSCEGVLKMIDLKRKKMDEVRETKVEVDWHHEKVDVINDTYEKGLQYWKRAALESVSNENVARESIELAPSKVILVSKAKNQKFVNIEEIIFHLKSQYLEHNPEDRTFIPNIPSEEPSFEAITDNLKTFSKSIKEHENMGLKNKSLVGGWLLMAANIYIRQNLTTKFEDWLYEPCRIKRQTHYNYRNLHRLISAAPKLMNCRVNVTFFLKNHEILFKHFADEEIQTPWKHPVFCACEDCISYFPAPV